MRYDAFLSRKRLKTNSYLVNQRYAIVDIANISYPELAPFYVFSTHVRCGSLQNKFVLAATLQPIEVYLQSYCYGVD